MKNINLVIGLGEVGTAIQKVLNCTGYDPSTDHKTLILADTIHICFPYSEMFESTVAEYQRNTSASTVVVHSTVPVGTCDLHGWIHSPVRGVHPNLEKGIRTFVKYFGGNNAAAVAKEWEDLGIQVHVFSNAQECEALKLWDTTQYGVLIMLQKEIKHFCDKYNLDFDCVYTHANQTYNAGYESLNRPEVVRPYLRHIDGPIGGHCVIPNANIILQSEDKTETPLVHLLVSVNAALEGESSRPK